MEKIKNSEYYFAVGVISKIIKLVSFIGLISIIYSGALSDSNFIFYIHEVDPLGLLKKGYPLSIYIIQFISWFFLIVMLPYWLGYLVDPNPDKGFLLKRWKI